MLLTICRDDLELFRLIVNEKNDSEITHSNQGCDLSQFFEKHNINENKYLYDFNIMDEWNKKFVRTRLSYISAINVKTVSIVLFRLFNTNYE